MFFNKGFKFSVNYDLCLLGGFMIELTSSTKLYEKLLTYFPKLEKTEDQLGKALLDVVKLKTPEFAANLKELRKKAGINQVPLCNYLGCTQGTYSAWENGSHTPRLSILYKLVELLQIDAGDLIDYYDHSELRKDVPLLDSDFFKSQRDDANFEYKLANCIKIERQKTYQVDVADDVYFAYKVKDNSMIGAYKSISSDSVLLVKKISRENLKEDDLYSQLSGKLVVANVCGRESVVRQVLFDGVNVSLQAWNANVPSLNAVIEGHSSSSYTTTNNICLFGVVTKAIQIFE